MPDLLATRAIFRTYCQLGDESSFRKTAVTVVSALNLTLVVADVASATGPIHFTNFQPGPGVVVTGALAPAS